MSKENLRPNDVSATLFVGMGGIGSKIIKGIATRALHDRNDSVRYCVLDTDVNDLTKLENGAVIEMIQTSSPRSIKDYLSNDHHAKHHWFPENRILDDKTVSEGAGQIRAISRLAVNATVKQGNIMTLYRCIDELYLKDGANKKQAIKVVIASTAAGGTGSGIAMITAMLIRQYIRKNYPESAAIIRGLLLLPGVMDTVIDTESERESLRRNGYATIKEINAFMMKGSGFFDSVPDLRRYKNLHISVPTTAAGNDRLDCLPFDFCFLMDRADSNQGSMQTLGQYIESAAQSLYEQNIGPMKKGASSKEDNIVKEFIHPDKLGRCRFGGVGAAILRYPYEDIRNYVSYDWLLQSLLGSKSGVSKVDDIEETVADSWIKYDKKFEEEKKKYDTDAFASRDDEPTRAKTYMREVENDPSDFSVMIRDKNLARKIAEVDETVLNDGGRDFKSMMRTVVMQYINTVVREAVANRIETFIEADTPGVAKASAQAGSLVARYGCCMELHGLAINPRIEDAVKDFAKGVFSSRTAVQKSGLEAYCFERLFTARNEALHPNSVRYLLYVLQQLLDEIASGLTYDKTSYEKSIDKIINGGKDKEGNYITDEFQVLGDGKEQNLLGMCTSIDNHAKLNASKVDECNKKLKNLANKAIEQYENIAKYQICTVAAPIIAKFIDEFEKFYASFNREVKNVIIAKESIVGKLKFRNGDIVINVCGKQSQLEMISEKCPCSASGAMSPELNANIFNAVRTSMFNAQKTSSDAFAAVKNIDIFNEIIVEYFRKTVEATCASVIDKDILRALSLEYSVNSALDAAAYESKGDGDDSLERMRNNYIKKAIEKAQNLAAPSIINGNFDERREVSAITCSVTLEDGEGLRVNDFLSRAEKSDTVSRYELRFFRSLYNVMPTQLSKFCDPDAIENGASKPLDLEANQQRRGEYFRAYQAYMEDIGPDCKKNAVITPHVDKRWNSISVMPELDLDYQHALMMNIHQAYFYGIIFKNIERYVPSKLDLERKVFRYSTGRDGYKSLTVSNGTECDLPYEVLDALYFDRAAVKALHKYESDMRAADTAASRDYLNTKFYHGIETFSRDLIVDHYKEELKEFEGQDYSKTSIFEIPMIYYNSLPPHKKDAAEIECMVDAIIFAVEKELNAFMDKSDINPYLAQVIAKHFNLLVDNYNRYPDQLGRGVEISSNDVMNVIRKKAINTIEDLDVSEKFVDMIKELR
ncbi:MAG: hypothetical protein J6Q94_03880 [Clostridia bacterium]|nr:hypothetical protein [Clostridia bacterium]